MTGVGTYILNTSIALSRRFPEEEYIIFSSSFKDRLNKDAWDSDRVRVRDWHIPVKLTDTAFNNLRFPPLQLFTGGFDIFHSPSPTLPPLLKCRKIATVHDLYFLKEPENSQNLSRKVFAKQIAKHLDMADAIICVSNFTADEVVSRFDIDRAKIRVIYHGADHILADCNDKAALPGKSGEQYAKDSLKKSFFAKNNLPAADILILFVGTIEPRKNPDLLLTAFESYIEQSDVKANLVYAGGVGWGMETFLDRLNGSKVRDRILVTGYQTREDLNGIYRIADILVMPSKEEGFGLPLIEAMKLGVPIAAANSSSIPEIGGDAVMYFESGSVEGLKDAMSRILENSVLRNDLIIRGKTRAGEFRWEEAAEKTMALYKNVLK